MENQEEKDFEGKNPAEILLDALPIELVKQLIARALITDLTSNRTLLVMMSILSKRLMILEEGEEFVKELEKKADAFTAMHDIIQTKQQ
jgi:hypothetical protein